MTILISILSAVAVVAGWLGYRKYVRLERLNRRIVLNSFLLLMGTLTLMTAAQWLNVVPRQAAAYATMGLYAAAAGFFTGYAGRLFGLKKQAGPIAYRYRSFWTDLAPNLVAVVLVAYGIYRTDILTFGPFTGIGITSGLSLAGFGFWGWTLSVVPEFRRKGVLMLDQLLPWKRIIAYKWISEETLEIDYLNPSRSVSSFRTFIPDTEKRTVERLLGNKIEEHRGERKELLGQSEDM